MPVSRTPRIEATFEFHVSRQARDQYQFEQSIFQTSGNVVFANFYAARLFAQKINAAHDLATNPERAVSAAAIAAMGLIDEINHMIFRQYRERTNPQLLADALGHLQQTLGAAATDDLIYRFSQQFPPTPVYRGEVYLHTWLEGSSGNLTNRELAIEELLMLWLANANPAFAPYGELFDDAPLRHETIYAHFTPALREYFAALPSPAEVMGSAGEGADNLIDLLLAPALAAPDSLEAQLAIIQSRFGDLIGDDIVLRVLRSVDVIKEEGRAFIFGQGAAAQAAAQAAAAGTGGMGGMGGGGVGDVSAAQIVLPDFRYAEPEPERFTLDKDWMPNLVLIAKNAFVWLDQLSKKYQRPIFTLDQIPDAELDALREAGISGLWLIGLWERSTASKRIKQIMGNHDAVASAYSLYDYAIAHDLGGDAAVANLRERAWQRGVRLASDMVPNHVGVDGRWVIEHPEWFVQLPYPPFPGYTFEGPDLSSDDRVGIFIEDGYYNRSDASVVFKRVDRWSGDARYIYHGNDGTSMPWNDTAQLDYLKAEVREAVIQTILHVAHNFPIIRFDAAMTLAKRHVHRLWYPEPGSGSDIASRAEQGMIRALFDDLMPQEFWREVVDRCAVEAPDTLLLAEAFWMMEGYFVRTLGMHRVYNSAFMVLLRDEDNVKFRSLIKNTLEFDTQIMQRYVNFLNNPDEKTAVEQFGRGEKYFGVCALMLTLPGLPMFGHGQLEGFTEKYGMEYRRAYYDETPDYGLMEHHRRVIYPLTHRRAIFAGADHFLLYDLYTDGGAVNEDVIAYSNRLDDQRSLVVYHNKHAEAAGWIKLSAAFAVKTGNGDEKVLVQRTLFDGLALEGGENRYLIMHDAMAGLEYIRPTSEIAERGMFVMLGAYTCLVFVDIREVYDHEGRYGQINAILGGRGTANIEIAADELALQPILAPLRALLAPELIDALASSTLPAERAEAIAEIAMTDEGAPPAADDDDLHETLGELDALDAELDDDDDDDLAVLDDDDDAADDNLAPLGSADDDGMPSETDELAALDAPPTPLDAPPTIVAAASAALRDVASRSAALRRAIAAYVDADAETAADDETMARVGRLLAIPARAAAAPDDLALTALNGWLGALPASGMARWSTALIWALVGQLGRISDPDGDGDDWARRLDEWLVDRVATTTLLTLGHDDRSARYAYGALRWITRAQAWQPETHDAATLLDTLLADEQAIALLGVNTYDGVTYFNGDGYADVLHWLLLAAALDTDDDDGTALRHAGEIVATLLDAAVPAGYETEKLLAGVAAPGQVVQR